MDDADITAHIATSALNEARILTALQGYTFVVRIRCFGLARM
jgi:hypothetical protein